jgi:GntR family transcriptional regulator/MocR family aminotransferase
VARWELALKLERSSGPLPRQIARAITAEIERGRLKPGQRLPGSRTLAESLGVHRQTVVVALEELAAEGWVSTRQASGTFVARRLPEPSRRSLPPSRAEMPPRFAIPVAPAPVPELPTIVPAGAILMSGTRPDVRLLPADSIGRAYRRVLQTYGPRLLTYSGPAGHPRLRRGLAEMLSATRGLAVDPETILITRGSQMALALTARALVRPGDVVAVEHPGYRPAWEAFRLAGARIVPVPVDAEGLDVEALRRLVAKQRLRALYVTPHHQFPTTVTLTPARRGELLRLAEQEGFAVIEDDYDHEFHYGGPPVLPLASADTTGTVIYVGTLSKVIAPGLRLGFVVAPADLIASLAAYRTFLDLEGDAALECALAELLSDGLIQRHVRKVRRLYQKRRDTLALALRREVKEQISFVTPTGGTAIWVTAQNAATMDRWGRRAQAHGVHFDYGSSFTLGARRSAGARLGFACLTESEIATAVERLASAR